MTAPKLPPLPAALFLAPTELGHNDAAMRAYGEAFAASATQAELERCAKLCDEKFAVMAAAGFPREASAARSLAAAIRRGE